MNQKNKHEYQTIEDLTKLIKTISERQNSQYTDIMMQLKELKDEIHSTHSKPKANHSDDELYAEAYKVVSAAGKASTSYIQRKLGIGYSRAVQLMDLLESKGVIGPAIGLKPRVVTIL